MNAYEYLLKTREGYLLVALIGMILIEYLMFYAFLFSDYKFLSFTIMFSVGILGLKANSEFWKERKLRGVFTFIEQRNHNHFGGETNG